MSTFLLDSLCTAAVHTVLFRQRTVLCSSRAPPAANRAPHPTPPRGRLRAETGPHSATWQDSAGQRGDSDVPSPRGRRTKGAACGLLWSPQRRRWAFACTCRPPTCAPFAHQGAAKGSPARGRGSRRWPRTRAQYSRWHRTARSQRLPCLPAYGQCVARGAPHQERPRLSESVAFLFIFTSSRRDFHVRGHLRLPCPLLLCLPADALLAMAAGAAGERRERVAPPVAIRSSMSTTRSDGVMAPTRTHIRSCARRCRAQNSGVIHGEARHPLASPKACRACPRVSVCPRPLPACDLTRASTGCFSLYSLLYADDSICARHASVR